MAQWPVSPTPILLSQWEPTLQSHPDQQFATYIRAGLSQGFRIGFDRREAALKACFRNHPSATCNEQIVTDYLKAEQDAGRIVGPLPAAILPQVKVSPIGLVPKQSQPGKFRMIVDLSYPRQHSVNSGISEDLASIVYARVDDAVACIQRLGHGTILAKLDLQSAYRHIPIHPQDQHLLGITWKGDTFVDRALPFGLRSAPKIFSAVADMLAWALFRAGVQHLMHYLDDFLFLGAPKSEEGAQALATALEVLARMGVPVATHKTEGPATCITFLGILIDTLAFQLRLPPEKISRLRDLLSSWYTKRSCTRKELESFLGHLSHAASVVPAGRAFLRELFGLLHKARQPHHFVRITSGARADICWWKCFLQAWSGRSFFPLPEAEFHVYSDASGSWGCGAFIREVGWFQVPWPPLWEHVDISAKELVPVVLAAALWGHLWSGKHIAFHSDNMSVVSVLTSRSARSPPMVHLLRCFLFYAAYYGFHYSAKHVPGEHNTTADALSRNLVSVFLPSLSQVPQFHIPQAAYNLLIAQMPDWGSPTWTALWSSSLARVCPRPLSAPITLADANTATSARC